MNEAKILIVDDELDLRNLITTALAKEGLNNVRSAGSVEAGWILFEQYKPDLAILDVMLPDGEGYELCRRIREVSTIPILFLSAKSEEVDKILGLAIGGDDYVTKPFSPKELAFRVKAQLRRLGYSLQAPNFEGAKPTVVGPFEMNMDGTEIAKDGMILDLTAKEVGLMSCFLKNANRILSKELLFEQVWGEDFYGADNTMMVHIRRLREKIEEDPSNPQFIKTIKGLGYKFAAK